MRKCVVCGKEFTPRNFTVKCCSKECSFAHKRAYKKERDAALILYDRLCLFCGKPFTPKTVQQRCCSASCNVAWQARRKPKPKRQPAEPKIRKCEICGQEFSTTSANKKYCSDACAAAGLSAAFRAPKRERGHWGPVKHKCVGCGKITPDHRCPACLAAWRAKHNVSLYAEEADWSAGYSVEGLERSMG